MEKKEMKISLWTFYVLVAAIVILIGATVLGWINVAKNNNMEVTGTILEMQDGEMHIYNRNYSYIADELLNRVSPPNATKGLQMDKKITIGDIDNITKLESAVFDIYFHAGAIKNYLIEKTGIKVKEIEKTVKEIYGENVTVKHESIPTFGLRYKDGKYEFNEQYMDSLLNNKKYLDEYETKNMVKAVVYEDELVIYEEYIKAVYDEITDMTTLYATSDNKLKLLETKIPEESAYDYTNEIEVKPIYKHTFKKVGNGKYNWVSSELTNKDELKILK